MSDAELLVYFIAVLIVVVFTKIVEPKRWYGGLFYGILVAIAFVYIMFLE